MDDALAGQLHGLLMTFLRGGGIDSFEDSIVPLAWPVSSSDPELQDIVNEIELALAEHSSRHATVADVRRLLRPVARRLAAQLAPPTAHAS